MSRVPSRPKTAPGEAPASLADSAYRRLEEAIVTLAIRPGTVLTEAQLIERVAIGRTPVREALIRLSQQGLVRILSRKGVQVTDVDVLDLISALDAREALEDLVSVESARRAGPDERGLILRTAQAMVDAAQAGDVQAYMRCDKQFDAAVAAAARSPYATRALEPLQALVRRSWYLFERESDLLPAARFHLAFARALAAGDAEGTLAASRALMRHLRDGLMARLGS